MPQVKPSSGAQKPEGLPLSAYIEPKDMYYNMNHKHRGLALIFNHEYFPQGLHSTRRGTKKDRDRLGEVLTNLGFRVETKDDLNYEGIHKNIQAVVKMDHSQHDCLVIIVLTHGELGMLYARDTKYSLRNLWRYFTDQNSPTLAGKPKLFFIQACRGDLYDNGITLTQDIRVDGASALSSTPTHPDFLFAFSTTAHHYSWRNSTNGSWFIQTLCDMLTEYATDTEILTWMTFVCRKVAEDYESFTPDEEESNEKKQMPSIYSTLTRLLIFTNNSKKKKMDCCVQS